MLDYGFAAVRTALQSQRQGLRSNRIAPLQVVTRREIMSSVASPLKSPSKRLQIYLGPGGADTISAA